MENVSQEKNNVTALVSIWQPVYFTRAECTQSHGLSTGLPTLILVLILAPTVLCFYEYQRKYFNTESIIKLKAVMSLPSALIHLVSGCLV